MNEKFILAIRATDMAGNERIVYSDAPNANGYHKGDVNVNIAAFDPPYSESN